MAVLTKDIASSFPAEFAPTDTAVNHSELAFHSDYPQIKMPFQVVIGGIHMDGLSLSLTKALVAGKLPEDLEYQDELISLRFDFDGFSITLFADAILSQDSTDLSAPISVFFTNPTDAHLNPLRYLINSYISGETVTLGHLLSVGATPQVESVSSPVKPLQERRSLFQAALFVGLGIAFLWLATGLVRERILLSYEPQPIQLMANEMALRATAAGQLLSLNTHAREGEIAFGIMSNAGEVINLRMPCDCEARQADRSFQGASVLAGEAVLYLSNGPSLFADHKLSSAGTKRLLAGDQAELVLGDGTVYPVELSLLSADAASTVRVEFPPELRVEGGPDLAQLRFNRLSPETQRASFERMSKWFGPVILKIQNTLSAVTSARFAAESSTGASQ